MADDNQQPSPESALTELAAAAAQLHELFSSYLEAGFTAEQALQLVIALITQRPNSYATPEPHSGGTHSHVPNVDSDAR